MTLTELTAEYYALIGKDHHKDKDCHFYIQKIYSYGDEPYWQYQFLHYGYCWSVENFFQDAENIKKYQEYFKEKKRVFNYVKNNFKEKRRNFIMDIPINLIECQKEGFNISEFPNRQTEQEVEQDMRNFLEWVIEKEKDNGNINED